jgi:CRP-like cAMP-binding protein
MNNVESLIATHPFTQALSPRYLHLLNECATCEQFGAQQQIFQEGRDADRCYLIHHGHVALQTHVPNRGIVTIETIGSGSVLGWSWLFPPYRWHFGALAVEATEVVALDARSLRAKMGDNHDFGYEVMTSMSRVILDRLQATRTRLLDLYDAPR